MGHCCANYLLYFLISWLPYYLIHERNLSMTSMAGTAGLLYGVDSFSAIAAGWIADGRIRRGSNPPLVRRTTMAIGFGIAALSLLACSLSGPRTYWWSLLAIGVGSGIANSASYTVGQTLAGARGAGRWAGLQNGFANISGVVGPPLTGWLIDRTGHFDAALAVAALVAVVGGLAWLFGVRRQEPVQWAAVEKSLA
jgi:MFS family permease